MKKDVLRKMVIMFSAFVAYLPTLLSSRFLRDDYDWLHFTQDGRTNILIQPLWGIIWRPAVAIYFFLCQFFFGRQPLFFHLVSIFFHSMNGLLLFCILKKTLQPNWAFGVSIIFLFRAIDAEAVFWPSAIGVLMASCFGLIMIYQQSLSVNSISSAGLFFLALSSKEEAWFFIFIPVLFHKHLNFRKILTPLMVLLGIVLSITLWRLWLIRGSDFIKTEGVSIEVFLRDLISGLCHALVPMDVPTIFMMRGSGFAVFFSGCILIIIGVFYVKPEPLQNGDPRVPIVGHNTNKAQYIGGIGQKNRLKRPFYKNPVNPNAEKTAVVSGRFIKSVIGLMLSIISYTILGARANGRYSYMPLLFASFPLSIIVKNLIDLKKNNILAIVIGLCFIGNWFGLYWAQIYLSGR